MAKRKMGTAQDTLSRGVEALKGNDTLAHLTTLSKERMLPFEGAEAVEQLPRHEVHGEACSH